MSPTSTTCSLASRPSEVLCAADSKSGWPDFRRTATPTTCPSCRNRRSIAINAGKGSRPGNHVTVSVNALHSPTVMAREARKVAAPREAADILLGDWLTDIDAMDDSGELCEPLFDHGWDARRRAPRAGSCRNTFQFQIEASRGTPESCAANRKR